MVSLHSAVVAAPDTREALARLRTQLESAPDPALICAFYDADHDDALICAFLRQRFPRAAVIGGTSCAGVMTEDGLGGAGSIGLLLIQDDGGNYGSAASRLGDDPAGTAERTLHAALENANCGGELPELIWIYQSPGGEESVIAGLRRVVGERCPIIGGSSADNAVAGQWRQLGPDGPMTDGLVVGVLFSSGGIGFAFQGGYEPTGAHGVVTRVGHDTSGDSGVVTKARGREILCIDGEPAAEVYNRWIGGSLTSKLGEDGNILTETTMFPLGIDAGKIEDVSHYLLIHPESILGNGGLTTFASVEEGTRLYSMQGDKSRLVERAGKVSAAAAAALPFGTGSLAGALIVYCAGCMLAVGDQMPKVSQAVTDHLGGKPFLGCFTFGEQGFMLDRNAHGNLMISAVAFGR